MIRNKRRRDSETSDDAEEYENFYNNQNDLNNPYCSDEYKDKDPLASDNESHFDDDPFAGDDDNDPLGGNEENILYGLKFNGPTESDYVYDFDQSDFEDDSDNEYHDDNFDNDSESDADTDTEEDVATSTRAYI
ncbi:hypothetical protein Bhyg_03240 [Pseudolycoriella hygida]|uniref:Transcription factor Iwr1 domain-containing protein n=1 Tax=Pseudolycoriella hygida TaxID=35572 RepID=A0A9Q0NCZ5_9DIPT|nr:hypothetical protein Bhyg_03240 [Pseudolycoriella hygida]